MYKATQLHEIQYETHYGTLWNVTRFKIEEVEPETIIIIKSRQGLGVRVHVMEAEIVVRTFKLKLVNFKNADKTAVDFYKKWLKINDKKP